MSLPFLLRKLFQNDGAGEKLNPAIIPTTVNGISADDSGNISVDANPPSISVSATTLAAGSDATVTKTGTDASPVFTFGIPQGAQGAKGDKGDKGDTGNLGTIGEATLYGTDVFVSTGVNPNTYTLSRYYTAVKRDVYGRVTAVGYWREYYNCNCNCDCSGSD